MGVDVYQQVTDRIIEALEVGTVPWRNPILGSGGAGWPMNLISGKPYRGTNVFLLAMTAWAEGYGSSYWLTFRQAKERGGSIRKGEKSSMVIFWKEIVVEDRESGEKKKVPVLRYYRVFNVSQCEGVATPDQSGVTQRENFVTIEAPQAIADGYQGPDVVHRGSRACYIPMLDEVRIPEPQRFETAELYYATLFHELVHSTGHGKRLDRGLETKLAPFGSPDYSLEELIAEMGAAFLCGHAGISPATLENSAAYLQGWLKRLRSDKRLVIQAGGKAQRAADYIRGATPAVSSNGDAVD